MAAAGYSATPTPKKLGIGEGARVAVLQGPADYLVMLGPLPAGATVSTRLTSACSLVHLFVTERADLAQRLGVLRVRVPDAIPVWVSWPKKASRVPTTVTEDVIREVALPLGFVDNKVCALSDVWSGLRLVVRKELRAKAGVR